MSHWQVNIDLVDGIHYTTIMPKSYPDENATNVCERICRISYPAFQESEKKYTVIDTKKIIRMEIEEVDE